MQEHAVITVQLREAERLLSAAGSRAEIDRLLLEVASLRRQLGQCLLARDRAVRPDIYGIPSRNAVLGTAVDVRPTGSGSYGGNPTDQEIEAVELAIHLLARSLAKAGAGEHARVVEALSQKRTKLGRMLLARDRRNRPGIYAGKKAA